MGLTTINGPCSIAFCMFTRPGHHGHHLSRPPKGQSPKPSPKAYLRTQIISIGGIIQKFTIRIGGTLPSHGRFMALGYIGFITLVYQPIYRPISTYITVGTPSAW